jgi:hypothetical protein
MKFAEWLKVKENLASHLPNMGQRAIPVNQNAPKRISLKDLAHQVDDPNWHHLYDFFAQQYAKYPDHPDVKNLGSMLHQSAQSKDMTPLQPYVAKYIHAQKI